jgi:hypothetical protein
MNSQYNVIYNFIQSSKKYDILSCLFYKNNNKKFQNISIKKMFNLFLFYSEALIFQFNIRMYSTYILKCTHHSQFLKNLILVLL